MDSSDVVIRVEGLGKKYALHHNTVKRDKTLRDLIAKKTRSTRRMLNPFTLAGQLRKAKHEAAMERGSSDEEFWALKDVSFEIRRGERVGIIGRNGAGKSTLLKILSRITEPTTGRVEIRGRVASLLEVGTGFHPELTGRENIYLNGAILGMSQREVRSKFDEIVDFAEIEKFLDTPVKCYSSGMYVRLAFAVAAHLEPEILVVDEVLAVGDSTFQKKCLGKMEKVAVEGSRTILFVSHQIQMVSSLCERGILLSNGNIAIDSDCSSSILAYNSQSNRNDSFVDYSSNLERPGDSRAHLIKAWIEDETGEVKNHLSILTSFSIIYEYEIFDSSHGTPYPNIHIYDTQGICVFVACGNVSYDLNPEIGKYRIKFIVPANLLNTGAYTVGIALTFSLKGLHVSFYQREELFFNIHEDIFTSTYRQSHGYTGPIPGLIRPNLQTTLEKI